MSNSPPSSSSSSSSSSFSASSYNRILIGHPRQNQATEALFRRMNTQQGRYPPVYFDFDDKMMTKRNKTEVAVGEGDNKKDNAEPQEDEYVLSGIRIGNCKFLGPGIGVLLFIADWDETHHTSMLNLVIAGTDSKGLRHIMKLAQPTIPPMMRAPFANQVPDYVVVDGSVLSSGAGGILAAGFWANDWSVASEVSYPPTC
mmetsp:Transcript_4733/g.7681  ORF Transcript_4733/g.7681 Transcript_4733/m.7681 type:complete len:200 (+) Transcript_4733:314-913(+)